MKASIVLAAVSVALALSSAANAQLVGVVVGVPDGDTLSVRIGEQVLNIDLSSIDAPEAGQPFGSRARQSLAELCEAKTVTLDELGIDRHRHVFGEVECSGVDAAQEQVRRGMAWATAREPASPLPALQAQARADHRGLWSDAAPVPPWEWSAIFTQ
jgi:endonuclease YncB( thermonuclease family)